MSGRKAKLSIRRKALTIGCEKIRQSNANLVKLPKVKVATVQLNLEIKKSPLNIREEKSKIIIRGCNTGTCQPHIDTLLSN